MRAVQALGECTEVEVPEGEERGHIQEQSAQQSATQGSVTRDTLAELLSAGHAAPLLVAFAEGGSPYSEASFEYGLQALIEGCAAALKRRAEDRTQ